MTVDVGRFASAEDEVALRIKREDLPGLFRKRLELPAGLVALVRHDGLAPAVVTGPATVDAITDAVLVKAARARIDIACDAGRSQDDLPVQASLGIELEARRTAIDLHQLERVLLGERGRAGRVELRAFFEPFVRDALRLFVAARTAEALATKDQRAALEDHLRDALKKPLFEAGVALGDVVHPAFKSDALDQRRQQAADARSKADQLGREKELVELRKGIEARALLADIEIKDEADRARKERRLAQFEALRAKMGDDDRKALVLMLDDDAQRARLIRELIDKDLSPEQRAGVQLSDMEARVAARLAELQQKLAQLGGGGLEKNAQDPITRRIMAVVGKRVLAFDPKTNLHPEVPKEVHDTEGGALGYLRSVRTDRIEGQEQVLAGAQRGVYRIAMDGKRVEYAFPREPEGKGGANAVAYFDGRVYATHSEMGLCEWPVGGGPGRFICEEVTRGQTATRGALVVDGHLYFSTGNDVLSLDLAAGGDRPARFKGSDDSITAFVVQAKEVVAGNRNGKLYRWSTDDPGSAEAFNVLKKNPIYMLRHARIAGQGFYIIGSKDFTITAAEPRRDVYREYQTREEVRWVDGAADFIVGVTRSGYKVLVWDAHHQTEPKLTIRVSDKVQDLFVQRALPAGPA